MRENSKRSAPGSNGKLISTCARAKKVAVLELCEIAPVASLGQINNIASDRAQKFKKDYPREQRQIKDRERLCVCIKCWSLRIARNHKSSIIRPNK